MRPSVFTWIVYIRFENWELQLTQHIRGNKLFPGRPKRMSTVHPGSLISHRAGRLESSATDLPLSSRIGLQLDCNLVYCEIWIQVKLLTRWVSNVGFPCAVFVSTQETGKGKESRERSKVRCCRAVPVSGQRSTHNTWCFETSRFCVCFRNQLTQRPSGGAGHSTNLCCLPAPPSCAASCINTGSVSPFFSLSLISLPSARSFIFIAKQIWLKYKWTSYI